MRNFVEQPSTKERSGSLCRNGNRGLVFRHVDALPFSALDAFPNLCSGFAFVRLFVGVEIFAFANPAHCGVFACITIEQAAVALAAVAVAIAGLLIEYLFDACGNAVSILGNWIGEE